jgi:hypothetical protein
VPDDFIDVGGIIITPETLAIPRAKATASMLQRGVLDYAALLECRRRYDGDEEILIVEVGVQIPQLKSYEIQPTERLALVFRKDDGRPDAVSLRPNFPQVPHLNLTATEYPRSLCLYEEDWAEVKSSWTPARFVERIRYWLAETVKGTLHKDDQPLEPLIVGSGYQIVVPHDLFSADVAVVAYKITERSALALILASATAVVFLTVWYVYPLVARERRKPRTSHNL